MNFLVYVKINVYLCDVKISFRGTNAADQRRPFLYLRHNKRIQAAPCRVCGNAPGGFAKRTSTARSAALSYRLTDKIKRLIMELFYFIYFFVVLVQAPFIAWGRGCSGYLLFFVCSMLCPIIGPLFWAWLVTPCPGPQAVQFCVGVHALALCVALVVLP